MFFVPSSTQIFTKPNTASGFVNSRTDNGLDCGITIIGFAFSFAK